MAVKQRDRISTAVAAYGRWREILPLLGVENKYLTGRHGPCPSCGGKDRFVFDDRNKDGDYFCRQCGAGKGVSLVMKINKWDFATAARAVDEVLRTNFLVSMSIGNRPTAAEIRIPLSVRQCALWLRKRYPEKLEAWLEKHTPEVRWWLETQTQEEKHVVGRSDDAATTAEAGTGGV